MLWHYSTSGFAWPIWLLRHDFMHLNLLLLCASTQREGSSPGPGAALERASAGYGSGARSCAMGINNSSTTWGKARCQWLSLSACAPHSHLHTAPHCTVLPSPTTEAPFSDPKEGVKLITWVAGLVSPPHYLCNSSG